MIEKGFHIGIGMTLLGALLFLLIRYQTSAPTVEVPVGREEVVFWHFWGGKDREVVQQVVDGFNRSQDKYFVRAIAMPGNNLQAKLFLSVAGGDPPDIVNQDDPVIPDWARRGVIQSLEDIAPEDEIEALHQWMFPAARKLSRFDNRMYGFCNGLDVRALYFNRTELERHGLKAPKTIADLDRIAETIAPPIRADRTNRRDGRAYRKYGYLPDTRRLWAWGYVFGGDFYDPQQHRAHVDSPEIVDALTWMTGYRDRYGADQIAAFRTGDQSLPNDLFPLLPESNDEIAGRYTVLMDGQWRVRDIQAFQRRRKAAGLIVPQFGVCPLPTPRSSSARNQAGWVNGNFFVFPENARNSRGAWEFAKYWTGFSYPENPENAAHTCVAGGWIPVSQSVVEQAAFQEYLADNPMFDVFVRLAASPNQFPTPQVMGASMFKRSVESAAYEAMFTDKPVTDVLRNANQRIDQQLQRTSRPALEAVAETPPQLKPK